MGKSKDAKKSLIAKFNEKYWEPQRDKHLKIISTLFFASILMLLYSITYLVILEKIDQGTSTAVAWALGVLGLTFSIIIGPSFFFYFGQYNVLKEFLQVDSQSELRRIRSDAEDAGKVLGPTYMEKVNAHLIKSGLKKGK
tara:strand:+ start:99 stop:518 length:420 start_codon:yes stop_codon:yes gene_type:complete